MDDSFKCTAFGYTAEDDCAERVAVNRAVGIQYVLAEHLDDVPPGRLVRLHGIAGELVGINDDCTALFEHLGDGAFPGRHAACESDENHRGRE
jgi:hypothetical protein